MAESPLFIWPPTKEFLRDLYFGGWRKQDIAGVFHKDIAEVDKLLKSYGIGARPSKPTGESRIPRNGHAGDGYWVYCERCRHSHMLCPPRPDGCDFGYVKTAKPAWHGHLLTLRDGYKCYACGYDPIKHRVVEWGKPWGKKHRLEMQHIRARKDGGGSCLHNLVQLCTDCHRKLAKGRKYGGIPKSEPHICEACQTV